jgi:putative hemolysin
LEPEQIMPEKAILALSEAPSISILIVLSVVMLVLIIFSALISGSEVAYFSLDAKKRDALISEKTNSGSRVVTLLESPKKLLATILIANNFINVSIVMVSFYFAKGVFASSELSEWVLFLINVIGATFVILLFGEVIPKVYATKHSVSFSKFMSSPISFLSIVFAPFSKLLVSSTSIIDKRFKKKVDNISVDDLEHAYDLTKESVETTEEKKILEGIVKFGQTDAKQIMTPRLDMIALEQGMPFKELRETILEGRYSRLPVYSESVDSIEGILYVKDLLVFLDSAKDINWVKLIREPKFIPENKKLDDLLKEFQTEKTHIAVVVDEYGGTSGIVTLEDVLEEIVGDITDEFDDDNLIYSKLDENNYVFEGKTPLMDMYRVMGIDGNEFEDQKGESDTIAGFCIELAGKILLKNEKISFENYTFTIEAADKRRIKQVKVTINPVGKTEEKG